MFYSKIIIITIVFFILIIIYYYFYMTKNIDFIPISNDISSKIRMEEKCRKVNNINSKKINPQTIYKNQNIFEEGVESYDGLRNLNFNGNIVNHSKIDAYKYN